MKENRTPILITGSIRSGTTWVGKMLAKAPKTGYLFEPFSPRTRKGINKVSFTKWYTYINSENGDYYKPIFTNLLGFKYNITEEIKSIRTSRDILRMVKDYGVLSYYKYRHFRPLLKDPIALFSSEWLANTFNMDVIVLIRHPAAFASSLKLKNWGFDFNNFIEQPALMRDLLYPFEKEIHEYAHTQQDLIKQACLLWNCFHHVINLYRKRNQSWHFIKHEDISYDPLRHFQSLFGYLELNFTPKVRKHIKISTGSHNPVEQVKGKETKRNSRENIMNWKKRLTPSEIDFIRKNTETISSLFYDEESWQF